MYVKSCSTTFCFLSIPEREQSVDQLRAEINRSDVICVVYSVEDEDTLDRVTGHWLPLIRSTLGQQHHTPVILVGNKVDLVDYSTMEVSAVLYCFSKIDSRKEIKL